MPLLLITLIVDIIAVLAGGIWMAKTMDQKTRDHKRKTYRLSFPADLSPEQALTWFRAISGTLRGGKLNLVGSPSIAFEVFATNKGIIHRLKIPYGHEPYIIPQLRLANINATPEEEFEDRNWVKGIEVGLSQSTRQLRIYDAAAVSASILKCFETFEPDQALIIQAVATPAAPRRLPVLHEDQTTQLNGRSVMRGAEAGKDEINDRRAKLEEPNFMVVMRVGAYAKTDAAADNLVRRIRTALASMRGPHVRFQKRLVRIASLRERIRKASSPVVYPMQLSAPELSALVAWPMGRPQIAGLAPVMTRHMPPISAIPMTGRLIGTSTTPGSERPVAVNYRHTLKHTYVLGPSGCLHPDTPIFDPVDNSTMTVKQRFETRLPFHVFALDGERLTVAQASPPVRYRKVGMYEVYSGDTSFVVTGQHRVWTGQEYVEVQKLYDQQASVPVQLPTISADGLSKLLVDAQHLTQTHVGSPDDRLRGCHLCDQRLREVQDSDLAFVPSQGDDAGHDLSSCGADGQVRIPRCSLQRPLSRRLSMPDFSRRRSLFRESESAVASSTFERPSWSPPWSHILFPYLGHSDKDLHTGQSALASRCVGQAASCEVELRLGDTEDESTGSLHQLKTLSQSHSCQCELDRALALPCVPTAAYNDVILFSNYAENSTFRVRQANVDVYYDFHVPAYENYLACGVIHHNSGKTTLLANMLAQDMSNGYGVILIEGKRDLYLEALKRIPTERLDDVIIIDLDESNMPIGFNILDQGNSPSAIEEISELIASMYSNVSASIQAPRVIHHMLRVLAAVPGHTFVDLPVLLDNHPADSPEREWQDWIVRQVTNQDDQKFLQAFMNMSRADRDRLAMPVLNRTWEFTKRDGVKRLLGQRTSSFQMADALASNKIVLVNLHGAAVGQQTASLVGTLLVSAAWRAAQNIHVERPNFIYLDEVQDFIKLPVGVEALYSKARSFNLGLVAAHQNIAQLRPPEVRSAMMSNSATKIIFQPSAEDAPVVAREFAGEVKPDEFLHLGAHQVVAKIAIDGGSSPATTVLTTAPGRDLGNGAQAIIRSSNRYGRPTEDVIKGLDDRPGGSGDTQRRKPKLSGDWK